MLEGGTEERMGGGILNREDILIGGSKKKAVEVYEKGSKPGKIAQKKYTESL